jgi:hypothetical protein
MRAFEPPPVRQDVREPKATVWVEDAPHLPAAAPQAVLCAAESLIWSASCAA